MAKEISVLTLSPWRICNITTDVVSQSRALPLTSLQRFLPKEPRNALSFCICLCVPKHSTRTCSISALFYQAPLGKSPAICSIMSNDFDIYEDLISFKETLLRKTANSISCSLSRTLIRKGRKEKEKYLAFIKFIIKLIDLKLRLIIFTYIVLDM